MAHAVRVTGFDSSSKRPAAAKHSSTDLNVRLRSFVVLDAILTATLQERPQNSDKVNSFNS